MADDGKLDRLWNHLDKRLNAIGGDDDRKIDRLWDHIDKRLDAIEEKIRNSKN